MRDVGLEKEIVNIWKKRSIRYRIHASICLPEAAESHRHVDLAN
jgi:hypothetical protein